MRKFVLWIILIAVPFALKGQINPADAYPDLFKAVQESGIFGDQKKFPDCTPLYHPGIISQKYHEQRNESGFNLRNFVGANFDTVLVDTSSIFRHIDYLWDYLTEQPDDQDSLSSLIALPYPYVVPGGRFREIYYWDSYFTMLGLQVAGKIQTIEDMADNFSYLIEKFGFIPNGNRTYYLSRSQPPFFSLMVDLLAGMEGDSVYLKYLPALEKEYAFWMKGSTELHDIGSAYHNAVYLEGGILNRYWDELNEPRSESYRQDILTLKESQRTDSLYRDLRAAAESGWDFSSRWFTNGSSIGTIHTTEIIPVDLNSLLYHLERTLQKAYVLQKDENNALIMDRAANQRQELLMRYCWNEDTGYFYDYNFRSGRQTLRGSLAGLFPLYFDMVDNTLAAKVIDHMRNRYLFDGGLVTTRYQTGEQWDYPNGWAPLQWIGYKACKNYGYDSLAHEIALRWTDLNLKVYFNTGKMLEKYNVVDVNLPGGGGEYPLQDGFGWTNGVFLMLWQEERKGDIP